MQTADDRRKRLKAIREQASQSQEETLEGPSLGGLRNPLAEPVDKVSTPNQSFAFYSDPLAGFRPGLKPTAAGNGSQPVQLPQSSTSASHSAAAAAQSPTQAAGEQTQPDSQGMHSVHQPQWSQQPQVWQQQQQQARQQPPQPPGSQQQPSGWQGAPGQHWQHPQHAQQPQPHWEPHTQQAQQPWQSHPHNRPPGQVPYPQQFGRGQPPGGYGPRGGVPGPRPPSGRGQRGHFQGGRGQGRGRGRNHGQEGGRFGGGASDKANSEDGYYHPSMVEDPWAPLLALHAQREQQQAQQRQQQPQVAPASVAGKPVIGTGLPAAPGSSPGTVSGPGQLAGTAGEQGSASLADVLAGVMQEVKGESEELEKYAQDAAADRPWH